MTRLSCLIPYEMGVGRCFQHVLGSPEGPLNLRLARLRRSITIACVALAWFCILYFAAQMLRMAF
jgi:hypothetical protein